MLRELGVTGRVLQKNIGEKSYVIFKGYSGLRNVFTGPRYLAANAKVVDMAIGKAGIRHSIRSGARLTIFLTVPLVILEHVLKDEFLLSNLVADLAVSMVKVGVATIVSAVAATAIGTVTTVAAAPLAVAIFVGLTVAWGLERLDEKFAITKLLGEVYEKSKIARLVSLSVACGSLNEGFVGKFFTVKVREEAFSIRKHKEYY